MSHLLAGAIGFFAGLVTAGGISLTVRALDRRRRRRLYRPHRYLDLL